MLWNKGIKGNWIKEKTYRSNTGLYELYRFEFKKKIINLKQLELLFVKREITILLSIVVIKE